MKLYVQINKLLIDYSYSYTYLDDILLFCLNCLWYVKYNFNFNLPSSSLIWENSNKSFTTVLELTPDFNFFSFLFRHNLPSFLTNNTAYTGNVFFVISSSVIWEMKCDST